MMDYMTNIRDSEPIKGTCPRGRNSLHSAVLRLLGSVCLVRFKCVPLLVARSAHRTMAAGHVDAAAFG